MSQRAVLVKVESNLIQEVFHAIPDYEEMCQICIDNGFDGTDYYSDSYDVEYEWLEIGDGEAGMDSFIDDETILELYDTSDYEKIIKERFDLDVETIETGSETVLVDDLVEE